MNFSAKKRPSSARRNINHETFNAFVSAARLRRVQALISDGSRNETEKPDAVLCITGIDSRYNDGMLELVNFLLFGFFESRRSELERSGFDEEVIDDILFLIQKDKVDVYCNPINYHYLLPYVSHWRNVFFHCLEENQYEDEDKAEDFKINTFVSIVKGCRRVGIPYSSTANPQLFDKMAIEKWPIIQVFGVEGVGGGGFFTMVHEVVDISPDLKKVYDYMDPVALETMIIEQISKLEHQWDTMLSMVEFLIGTGANLLEDKIFEPLKSYYMHGCVSKLSGNSKLQPFVLFGKNSCKKQLDAVNEGQIAESKDIISSGVSRNGGNFMVCRAVSPRGPVSCTRTYFFTRDFVNPFQDAKVTDYEKNKDLRMLVMMYGSMIDGLIAGIQTYCNTLSVNQATDVAMETLHEGCSGIQDREIVEFLKKKQAIEFQLEAVDKSGGHHVLAENKQNLMVKYACFNIYDVPSLEEKGQVLGSMVLSEMFMDSAVQVQNQDGSVSMSGSFLLLTDHIPRHKAWAHRNLQSERQLLQSKLEDDSLSENFGKLLLSGDPVCVGCSSTLCLPPEEASLYAYENGIVIMNQNYGAVVLHGNHIKSVYFYDGDSMNTVAVLVIEYQPNFVPFVPFHLVNEDCQLILLFAPKSKAYKHLYSDVLHTWRGEKDFQYPKVHRVDNLPDNCYLLHTLLQHRYFSSTKSTVSKTALQRAAVSLPHFYRFLNHFSVSSCGGYPVPEKDLHTILNLPSESKDLQDTEVVVTVISGTPGSYQDKLCDVLSGLSKDQNRYVVLKQVPESNQCFSAQDIQAKLKATLNVHRRRKQGQLLKNTRVLYVVPGYTDIVNVVQAIECHPDRDVRNHCAIGSVTVCVDPLNTFMENKYTFPKLLSVCAQGWVNQIVMTSSTSLQNESLAEIQYLLRSANCDVAFLLADNGQVSRSMDLDAILSEESFREETKVRARHLLCPGWSSGLYKPRDNQMTTVQLRFSLPLDRKKLVNKLNGLKGKLHPYPFTENIYNVFGKVRFIGTNSDQPFELQYTTMSSVLELLPMTETAKERSQRPGNYITFIGCDLTESAMKNWLKECAPHKPEKKAFITRKDVTKEEISKIHKEHHLDRLPEGWFYSGNRYVSFDGTKQESHPDLETFIEEYVKKKNAVIEAYNHQIEEQAYSYKDLFSEN